MLLSVLRSMFRFTRGFVSTQQSPNKGDES